MWSASRFAAPERQWLQERTLQLVQLSKQQEEDEMDDADSEGLDDPHDSGDFGNSGDLYESDYEGAQDSNGDTV